MNWRGEPEDMGRVTVEISLANNRDVQLAESGALEQREVRRVILQAVVDTGATHMVLPARVVEQLGLPMGKDAVVHYADHRTAARAVAEEVRAELLGRHGTFRAMVEPARSTVLIGAIVLGDLDLLVDCTHQTLQPRDPEHIIAELE